MFDPLTAATLSLDQIVEMCDELIAAHGDLLPLPKTGTRIALVGPFAGASDLFGPWRTFPGQTPPVGIVVNA